MAVGQIVKTGRVAGADIDKATLSYLHAGGWRCGHYYLRAMVDIQRQRECHGDRQELRWCVSANAVKAHAER